MPIDKRTNTKKKAILVKRNNTENKNVEKVQTFEMLLLVFVFFANKQTNAVELKDMNAGNWSEYLCIEFMTDIYNKHIYWFSLAQQNQQQLH